MDARLEKRLRLLAVIAAAGTVAGLAVNFAQGRTSASSMVAGIAYGLLMSVAIGGTELFVLQGPMRAWLGELSFTANLMVRSAIYAAIIVVIQFFQLGEIAAGLPLIIATPVLGLLLNLDAASTSAVALTLLAGTPALTFTGMIGAALAVTLHRGGLLLAVLVLPLSIPVLIFGVAASQAAISGPLWFGAPFSILCALSLVSFVVGPFAAAASLRQGLD